MTAAERHALGDALALGEHVLSEVHPTRVLDEDVERRAGG
jgi:hypothetical protein